MAALFGLGELIDLIIMVVGVGYIFTGLFSIPHKPTEIPSRSKDFLYAVLIAAPAVVFHEAAHKIVALLFGLSATFHASYYGLGLGVLLKFMNFGIFFIPGYVSIAGATHLQSAVSAFAGPGLNLLLAVVAIIVLKYVKGLTHRTQIILMITKKLNLFLFVFNMLPIPPFDGSKVFFGGWQAFQSSGLI